MLIKPDESVLLVIDVQERLLPVMHDPDAVVANTNILLQAAARIGVPVVVSEQYPRGLGPTVEAVRTHVPSGATVEKLEFSCHAAPDVRARIDSLGRRQVILAGIEAHVCVLQSAIGLREGGYATFVVADATSSRRPENQALGQERMRDDGVAIVSTEMVVFEWIGRAGSDVFKDLTRLIK